MFEGIVLATGSPIFYKKVLIDIDIADINSVIMEQVFDRMTILCSYVDDNFSDRDWDIATSMLINGKAAFQITGDWAKREFFKANLVLGKDFIGIRIPDTQGSVIFSTDQFIVFEIEKERKLSQKEFIKTIMSSSFQEEFSKIHGSVPSRNDITDVDFDIISKKGIQDIIRTDKNEKLFDSVACGYVVFSQIQNIIFNVVTNHFEGKYSYSKQAVQRLV